MDKEVKLRELILYISGRQQDVEAFGSTVLNKLLFFTDFASFRAKGESVTGATYQALEHGPAPRRMPPALQGLIERGDLELESRDFHGMEQVRPRALRKPNLEMFSAWDLAVTEEVMRWLSGRSGKDVSNLSHKFEGWSDAGIGNVIPYASVQNTRDPFMVGLADALKRFLVMDEEDLSWMVLTALSREELLAC